MKHTQSLYDVPSSGDALLVTPKGTDDQLARVLVMAVMSLVEVLRHQPVSFMLRFADGRPGIVFTEPSPRPLVEQLVDLLDASEEPVRLEELGPLSPVLHLSPQGIRVYVAQGPPASAEGPPN